MEEKALDKIDIQSELKTLSPIEKKSIELKAAADAAEVKDKETYTAAKKIRKDLVSHRTDTKNLRLTFTRKLDNLKDQFIKKQDEVLEPSLAGEKVIKDKIADWEKIEEQRKAEEQQRIDNIIVKLRNTADLDRKTGTLEDIKRARAALKMERGLLDTNDRNKVAIKNVITEVNEVFDETEQYITERIEQERIAEEQKKEQERLDAERKELDDKQAAIDAEANMKADKERLEQRTGVHFDDTTEGREALQNNDVVEPVIEGQSLTQQIQNKLNGSKSKEAFRPTATWELVTHGHNDPDEAGLAKIAKQILDGYNIGEYEDIDPEEETE